MDTLQGSVAEDEFKFPPRISARGVIAGMLVALAVEAMLIVLGAAVGLTAIAPRGDVIRDVGIGFAAWVILTMLVSGFVGAWVSAGAARAVRPRDGVLHGVVTWAAVALVSISVLGGAVRSTIGGMLGLAESATQAAASSPALNQAAGGAAQEGGVQQRLNQALDRSSVDTDRMADKAQQAAGGAAIGGWGLFAALFLPLFTALAGGALGSRRERRVSGLTDERTPRRPLVVGPRQTGGLPSEPVPIT